MNLALFGLLLALQQAPAPAPQRPETTVVRAGRLIDGIADEAKTDQGILVAGERIAAVGPWSDISRRARGARVIDLSRATVLPGLIDDHTHILLQGDITSEDYDTQLLDQSIPFRAILATRNVRAALLEGYTALRDVETEGAMYADVDVKRAINQGVITGPRLFVSTRAMAPTGMYPIQSANWQLDLPKAGVKIANGTDAGGYSWSLPLAREFTYLVQYGMTPMQAIKAGTSVAAELLGQQNALGSIEAGRFADLIAVTGNPLTDITELERVKFVMKGGVVYQQEQ